MSSRSRILLLLFSAAVMAAALTPIRSWDYFWHLSTGEWILQHGQLPERDPFSVGSDDSQWIDGAWLFQLAIAALHRIGSHEAVSIARAVCTSLLLIAVFLVVLKRCDPWVTLTVCSLSAWGAWTRLDARPETAGIACAALAVMLLQHEVRYRIVAYGALTALWMNLHPSALLSIVFAVLAVAGALIRRERGAAMRLGAMAAAGALALLVNPWGLAGVRAPLGLASQVESGTFVNLEWLPSDPRLFPLLYLVIIAGGALLLRDRLRHPFETLLFVALAVLAMRWVRNQGFFFVLMPLALAPMLSTLQFRESQRRLVAAVAIAALVLSLSPVLSQPPGLGPRDESFPVRSARLIRELGLDGNIFNADQFGGFLIWSLFPERRVLIDGRNELYTELIPRLLHARTDGRAWQGLIAEHDIRIAVEEHAAQPLEVRDAATGEMRFASPSLSFFPREQWALLAVDPASMLFVRRDSVSPAVLERYEYREWRPDLVDRAEIGDASRYESERIRGLEELGRGEPVS